MVKTGDYLELDRSTGYLIRRTFRGVNRALETRLRPHGLSASMWFILRVLWERDGLTQREIGEELILGQPAVVSVLDTLERRGLIERRRNSADRRKINIHLTKQGLELRQSLSPVANEVNALAVSGLSRSEIVSLWALLDRIVDALDADARDD